MSAVTITSSQFLQRFGEDWNLVFNVSAKADISENEIRGPSIFKKTKDVEFTVFLPFDVIQSEPSVPQAALGFLLQGVGSVFQSLGVASQKLKDREATLIERICADPKMFKGPFDQSG